MLRKTISLLLPLVASVIITNGQIASWSFNNTLTGTGSANAVAGNASLGSSIAIGDYNGSTVYFGEDGWPSGALDAGAYLEFSITPTAGHTMTLAALVMQIRRSTTGTSGAGPNNWALRSNLDGYVSNISSGVLSQNSTPATTVTLGVDFINLSSKVIFRLYGYNATISSGGLNRFVYDNIVVTGSSVLPIVVDYFHVKNDNNNAGISWKLAGDGDIQSVVIERAIKGQSFEKIKLYSGDQINTKNIFEYTDELNNPDGDYAYRLQLISADGRSTYSAVQTVSFTTENGFSLQAFNAENTGAVNFRVHTDKAGNYSFSLYNLSGNKVAGKSVQLPEGSQTVQMENRQFKSGLYILLGENGKQQISTKIYVY